MRPPTARLRSSSKPWLGVLVLSVLSFQPWTSAVELLTTCGECTFYRFGNGTLFRVGECPDCKGDLDLRDSGIADIQEGTFEGLMGISSLFLSNNNISSLDSRTFAGLDFLQFVHLYENRVSSIELDTFAGLRRLKGIDLYGNRLTEEVLLSGAFADMGLLDLLVGFNQIVGPITASHVRGLEQLDIFELSGNNIQSIHPDALRELTGLTTLWAWEAGIERIEAGTFKSQTLLRELDLTENLISRIDGESFEGLESMQELWLSYNNIEFLNSSALSHMEQLISLQLEGNRMQSIPPQTLESLGNLEHLWLGSNEIRSIEPRTFKNQVFLQLLELHDNFITQIGSEDLLGLGALTHLTLDYNQITNTGAAAFGHLTSLEELWLAGNPLGCVGAIPNGVEHWPIPECPQNCTEDSFYDDVFSICRSCPEGTTIGGIGSIFGDDCSACSWGSFLERSLCHACTVCRAGEEFQVADCTSTQNRQCAACFPSSPVCGWECGAGYYDAGTHCETCPVGTFKRLLGNSGLEACVPCNDKPAHSDYLMHAGQAVPECPYLCNAGYGTNSCTPCPAGMYKDSPGNHECEACKNKPNGTEYAQVEGFTSPDCPFDGLGGSNHRMVAGIASGLAIAAIAAIAICGWRWRLMRKKKQDMDCSLHKVDIEMDDRDERESTEHSSSWAAPGPASPTGRKATGFVFDMFPKHIAEAMFRGDTNLEDSCECATVFFSDIVGFTHLSSQMDAEQVSRMLDTLFSKFDYLAKVHGVYKVETIGDCYIGITNLIDRQEEDHAARIARFSLQVLEAAAETLVDETNPSKGHVTLRVGFACGPVVGKVVGTTNKKYTLFGNTVNLASRMESTGLPGRIQCTMEASRLLLEQDNSFEVEERGFVEVKGHGKMETFLLNGLRQPENLLVGDEACNPSRKRSHIENATRSTSLCAVNPFIEGVEVVGGEVELASPSAQGGETDSQSLEDSENLMSPSEVTAAELIAT